MTAPDLAPGDDELSLPGGVAVLLLGTLVVILAVVALLVVFTHKPPMAVWFVGAAAALLLLLGGAGFALLLAGAEAIDRGLKAASKGRAEPAERPADPAGAPEEADIDALPEDLAAIVKPFVRSSRASAEDLRRYIAEAARLVDEQERYARAETLAADWRNERALAGAREAYLAGLSPEERGLLALHLDASARAACDWARLAEENTALRRRIDELEIELAAVLAAEDGSG